MFEELAATLAKRGVNLAVTGRYSTYHRRMSYTAEVTMDRFRIDDTWPDLKFKVYGRELDELAEDINRRLPLVEPIIAAVEKHRQHEEVLRKARSISAELSSILKGEATVNEGRAKYGIQMI